MPRHTNRCIGHKIHVHLDAKENQTRKTEFPRANQCIRQQQAY